MQNPINTALLSFGMSGSVFHAPFIAVNKGFRLYGVWERTRQLAAEKYPGIRSFHTLETLLEDPAIELVIVNTPNTTHYAYALQALAAGKHVIVEKPFTIASRECEQLVQLSKQKGTVLSVYQNRRFDSDFMSVKKILEESRVGNVMEAEFHFDRYKGELSAKLHKETPGLGTGALYDLGAHLIDQALHLFGFPQSVFADIRIIRPLSQVDDYFELLLYYEGLRVRLHCSYLMREPLPAFSVHGNKGSFIKRRADPQEGALQAGEIPGSSNWGVEPEGAQGFLHAEKNGKEIKQEIVAVQGNYGLYYEGIFQSIRNGASPPVTGEEGMQVIQIIEAAFKSSRERAVVDI